MNSMMREMNSMIREQEKKDKKERLREALNIKDIYIARVPDTTYRWFRHFADTEFCGDFGMALRHICDFYTGLIQSGVEHLEEEIVSLREEMTALRNDMMEFKAEQKKPKPRKLLNGKEIRIGG